MLRFACYACGAVLSTKAGNAEKKANCPKCGQRIQVPAPDKTTALANTHHSLRPPLSVEPAEPPPIRYSVIDNAVSDLRERRILDKREFERLVRDAAEKAFTVAGVDDSRTLETIRNVLAECVEQGPNLAGFKAKIRKVIGLETVLSDSQLEHIFQTYVHKAYAKGLERLTENPIIAPAFPYRETLPIRDDRLTDLCRIVAESGMLDANGRRTAIYRADDPVWQKIRPPIYDGCRCGTNLLPFEMAAEKGVLEAICWVKSGQPPAIPERVPMPKVQLLPGWNATRS
jgi:hypothetical protein